MCYGFRFDSTNRNRGTLRPMRAAGATDVGQTRAVNEDSILLLPEAGVFAVADGMGGHRGGKVASQMAVGELTRVVLDSTEPFDAARLRVAVEQINQRLHEMGATTESLEGMGTTCTVISVHAGRLSVAHVGDSTLLVVRGGVANKITLDHRAVQELVDRGTLSETDAQSHPLRNLLTRSVGVEQSVEVDVFEVALQPADILLLCSDGLSEMVAKSKIVEVLNQDPNPETAARALVKLANENGGLDNISVVVVRLEDSDFAR